MGLFSARKRGNEAFRERAKMRRQAQQTAASQPKPAPEPTPAHPNPEPPTAAGVPYLPSDKVGSDDVIDTPDVATLADGGIVESPEQPLGDLREVAERAEAAQEKPFGAAELADALRVPREWLTDVGIEPEPNAEPEPEPAPETEPEPDQSGKRGRGRPRPQETIDRDEAVHGLLLAQPEGISKAEIANVLREKEQQVYSSLRQLSKEGRAETRHVKDVGYRWFALTD